MDVALVGYLKNKLVLDFYGELLEVSFQYENCPAFCSACNKVGHEVTSCRLFKHQLERKQSAKAAPRETTPIYDPKTPVSREIFNEADLNRILAPKVVGSPRSQKMGKDVLSSNMDSYDKNLNVVAVNGREPVHSASRVSRITGPIILFLLFKHGVSMVIFHR